MTTREILLKAADLIEPEGKWTQGAYARTVDGTSQLVPNDASCCFCAVGALIRLGGTLSDRVATDACLVLGRVLRCRVSDWNDDPRRTQAEVVAALRKAAALAED